MLRTVSALLSATWLLIVAFDSSAQPSLLKSGDRVTPVRLLEFEDEPNHFLFVGKSPRQYHVFDIQAGVVREILMLGGAVMHDGGSLDLYLDGSLRLFVPSDQKYNYVDGQHDSYLIFPDRARERLVKREISHARLKRLRLSRLLKKEKTNLPASTETVVFEPQPHQVLPNNAQFVLITTSSNLNYAAKLKLADTLKSALSTKTLQPCFTIEPWRLFSQGTYLVTCPPEQVEQAVRNISAIDELQVLHLGRGTDLTNPSNVTIDSFDDAIGILLQKDRPLNEHLLALSILVNQHDLLQSKLTEDNKDLFWSIHIALDSLSRIQEAIAEALMKDAQHQIVREENIAVDWLTFQNLEPRALERVQQSELETRLLAPLRGFAIQMLSRLRELGNPELTYMILKQAETMNGAGLPLLKETWNRQFPNETFLDGWLRLLTRQVQFMDSYPELPTSEDLNSGNWKLKTHGGGIFGEIKLSGELVEAYQWNQISLFGDDKTPAPLVVLGETADDRVSKKKIIGFIIQSDKIIASSLPKISETQAFSDFIQSLDASAEAAPYFRQFWRNGDITAKEFEELKAVYPLSSDLTESMLVKTLRPRKARALNQGTTYNGHVLLVNFIKSLTWPPPLARRQSSFSEQVYYTNVIDILVELLEDSEDVIHTQGTYLSLLDSAVGLQKLLRYGETVDLRQSEELTTKLDYLGQVIQRKLLQPLPLVQMSFGKDPACSLLLSPRPWKTAGEILVGGI